MADLNSLQKAVLEKDQAFLERLECAVGYGYDHHELREGTRYVADLLRCYRAGTLSPGQDTGEFIEGHILLQASMLAHAQDSFLQWMAEEQTRFSALMAWVHASNAHAAALAREGGDAVERGLADQLQARTPRALVPH